MAIVTYKCDVCKREIELQRNIHGLETPHGCIITHGCRGKLYFKELLTDFVRGQTPEDVIGLDNWQQRRVLFNHEQAIERDEWIIIHNLGNSVSVSAFVNQPTQDDPDNLVEIDPDDIIIDSADAIRLRFSRPYSGIAQLVARASDPQLLQPVAPVAEAVVTSLQLSNLGEITLATKIPADGIVEPIINVQLTFSTPQETTQVFEYVVDDSPQLNSPWVDFNNVIINGSLYVVRSFYAIKPEMVSGVVGNGSTFRFTAIDAYDDTVFRPIVKDEMFLLLAASPFTTVDKITEQVTDVTDVTETLNPFSFAYDTGEFFTTTNTLQTIYPPVRSA